MTHFFKSPHQASCTSFGLLLLRLVAGLAFMYHGFDKIQNPLAWMGPDASMPGILQALAAIGEFGGGAAWIVGLFTPIASFLIACTMAVANYTHFIIIGDPFVSNTGGSSAELATVFLAVSLLFLFAGPGKYSLDRLLFGER